MSETKSGAEVEGRREPEQTDEPAAPEQAAPEPAAIDPPDPARALPRPEAAESGVEEPAPETLYCPQCGGGMGAADRYCHACGWDAENPDAPPPGAVASPRDLGPLSPFNRTTVLLLCLLLGFLGVHRFYVGKVGTGILWVLTLSFFGVGWIYDLVLVATGEFRDEEGRRVWHWQ